MRSFNLGTGVTVFIIFFGISVLEAFRSANYLWIMFWLAMGFVFWSCDTVLRRRKA
jgi:hypothetical protein